jgi:hypothetical protein
MGRRVLGKNVVENPAHLWLCERIADPFGFAQGRLFDYGSQQREPPLRMTILKLRTDNW